MLNSAQTFFAVSTVNGDDLDWHQFNTLADAEKWITESSQPRRYKIVTFYITHIWTSD